MGVDESRPMRRVNIGVRCVILRKLLPTALLTRTSSPDNTHIVVVSPYLTLLHKPGPKPLAGVQEPSCIGCANSSCFHANANATKDYGCTVVFLSNTVHSTSGTIRIQKRDRSSPGCREAVGSFRVPVREAGCVAIKASLDYAWRC